MKNDILNKTDRENLTKAVHASDFLCEDLRVLNCASNPLLAEICANLLVDAVAIRVKLERLQAVTTVDP